MIADDIADILGHLRLESLCRLGDDEWQAIVSDDDQVYRATGDSIEMALTLAIEGTPIGTLFATAYAGDRSKPAETQSSERLSLMAALGISSKKLVVARRV